MCCHCNEEWLLSESSKMVYLGLQSFSSLVPMIFWADYCCGGLHCELQVVQHHSWPLPTRCQQYIPTCENQKCLYCQISPGQKSSQIENRWVKVFLVKAIMAIVKQVRKQIHEIREGCIFICGLLDYDLLLHKFSNGSSTFAMH